MYYDFSLIFDFINAWFVVSFWVDKVEEEVLKKAQCLFQIRQLISRNVKALCLIRVGRIGKTTIAKATLNCVKYTYDASCFIECIKSGSDCYKTTCNILE